MTEQELCRLAALYGVEVYREAGCPLAALASNYAFRSLDRQRGWWLKDEHPSRLLSDTPIESAVQSIRHLAVCGGWEWGPRSIRMIAVTVVD